jgi:hypothetical protein
MAHTLAQVSEKAHALLAAVQCGRIKLSVPEREGEQLRRLETVGRYAWPSPPGRKRCANPCPPPGLDARSLLPSRGAQTARPAQQGAPGLRAPDAAAVDAGPDPPSLDLLRALVTLSERSTAGHPLEILTLLRPPYRSSEHPHGSPTNVHSRGMAADIAAYSGHRIDPSTPEESVRMMLALLRDLPPGRYRLGVPKAPELPAVVGQPHPDLYAIPGARPQAPPADGTGAPAPSQPAPANPLDPAQDTGISLQAPARSLPVWPFFPPQEFALEGGLVAPERHNGKSVHDGASHSAPVLLRFGNERYAPEEALGDERVKRALAHARRRGVDVWALFPDAADHIHVDVLQPAKPGAR